MGTAFVRRVGAKVWGLFVRQPAPDPGPPFHLMRPADLAPLQQANGIDLDLFETVFRELLTGKELKFMTLLLSIKPLHCGKNVDPPDALLLRLSDLHLDLRKASEGRYLRTGDGVSDDHAGAYDADGKRALECFVCVDLQTGAEVFEVEGGQIFAPLHGGGGRCRYRKEQGRWISRPDEDWIEGWVS